LKIIEAERRGTSFELFCKRFTQDFHEKRLGIGRSHKAAFPFLHGTALAEAGHEVQIFLLGEAVNLMRESDLASTKAKFGNPQIFVQLTEWADRIITE
jgi:predicted peroxiredoxin